MDNLQMVDENDIILKTTKDVYRKYTNGVSRYFCNLLKLNNFVC